MNKAIILLVSLSVCISLHAVEIEPGNIFLDHYELIPPLGKVKSMATSMNKLFAISDNYLLIFDRNDLHLTRVTYFKQEILFLAYDQFFDELWIASGNSILRYNISLGSIREYHFTSRAKGIGIAPEKVYISALERYALDRNTGKIEQVVKFPEGVRWFREFNKNEVREYKFLNPYFYQDGFGESNDPLYQYAITSLYDDGMFLFVGTEKFGILRYNKVSLEKVRVVYGPLSTTGVRLRKIGSEYYFVSSSGVSSTKSSNLKQWTYFRLRDGPGDLLYHNDQLIVSYGNQLTRISGNVSIPLTQFRNQILSLGMDNVNIYVGTDNGMYRIIKETTQPLEFGPDQNPVYVIHSVGDRLYVGGELALYLFDKQTEKWYTIFNRGVRDISEVATGLYFLTTDNQLIEYASIVDSAKAEQDTNIIILPYFNIYDIDSDGKILYCATGSGINYYDPETRLYTPLYQLPRIKYNYVGLIGDDIIAVSDYNIYRLSKQYRD